MFGYPANVGAVGSSNVGKRRSKAARLSELLDLLATRGQLSVDEAAEALEVSPVTIRRDFADLAERQLAARHHGGITATAVAYQLPYRYRESAGDRRLGRMAEALADLAPIGGVIAFNGGTTTTEAARAVVARAQCEGSPSARTTLVTNALNIAAESVLRTAVQVVQLGGTARPESYEVTGPLAARAVSDFWFDLAVIGVNGISAAAGASCEHPDEAALVRVMIARSSRTIVLADGAKVGRRAMSSICPADAVDVLITTAEESAPEVVELRAGGMQVLSV